MFHIRLIISHELYFPSECPLLRITWQTGKIKIIEKFSMTGKYDIKITISKITLPFSNVFFSINVSLGTTLDRFLKSKMILRILSEIKSLTALSTMLDLQRVKYTLAIAVIVM